MFTQNNGFELSSKEEGEVPQFKKQVLLSRQG